MNDYMSLEEFEKTEAYQNYIKQNPSVGTLKVQVFTADQAIPISDTEIYITKEIGNQKVLFFRGITDSSGIIDNIKLPAPYGDYNLETFEPPKYTTYDLVANNSRYQTTKQYTVSMFGDIKILQYIKMLPSVAKE